MTVVEAANVSVQLESYVAVRAMNFALPEGSFLALLGPNGAGKSTLIRAMMALMPVTSGTLTVLGKRPGESSPDDVGYVPQMKTLDRNFPALPIELVVSGLRKSWPWRISRSERELAMETLRVVGMEDKASRPIAKLSGGELQRVYLARAFARKPRLVILDEPATGMDALVEADMYRLLDEYRHSANATIFMITHDWEVARHHATHVLLMNREQIAFGPPDDVLAGDPLRRAYGHVGHAHPMHLRMEASADHHHDHGHGHEHTH
ncbi:ABC transporter ATP-binding protein [soil metagenome]